MIAVSLNMVSYTKYYTINQCNTFQLTAHCECAAPKRLYVTGITHLPWRSIVPNGNRSEDMSLGGKVEIRPVSLHRYPLKVQLHTEPQDMHVEFK